MKKIFLTQAEKLAKAISSHGMTDLTRNQNGRITEVSDRMEFQLKELLKESETKQKELAEEITLRGEDIKIKSMEKILKIINEKTK